LVVFAIGIFRFYNLFTITEKPPRGVARRLGSFLFSASLSQAALKLGGGEFDQNGILTDALDTAPRDAVMLAFSEAEEAAIPLDDEGCDLPVLNAELQRMGIPQPSSVAEVDDLHTKEIGGGDFSHDIFPP